MSIHILVAVLILLTLYWVGRNLFFDRLTTEFKMKLFKLRDKGRRYAIQNKLDEDEWVYEYLDLSISKMICHLEEINMYSTIYLSLKHNKNKRYKKNTEKIRETIKKNPHAQEIYNEYIGLMLNYFYRKHSLTRYFFIFCKPLAFAFLEALIWLSRLRVDFERPNVLLRQSASSIPFMPETSALNKRYYYAH